MAFATGYLDDPRAVGAGEQIGENHIAFTYDTFEDNLVVGRFAKLDSGSLDNMDGSATPTVAGVVLRKISNATEDGSTIDNGLYDAAEAERFGLATVDIRSGLTITKFDTVYAYNAAGADVGKATNVGTDAIEIDAEFIEEVSDSVWTIRLK